MDDRPRGGVKFKSRARVAAASALLAASLCLVPSVALANPAIDLSPEKGPVGTSLTVSGDGFEAHSIATVHWDNLTLTDFTTSGSGDFAVAIVVPQVNNGAHDVVVTSTAGTASARFVVQGSEPTTTTSEPTTTTEPTTTSTSTTSTTSTTAPTTTTAPSPTTTAPTTTAPTSTTTTTPSMTGPAPTTTTPNPNTTSTPDTKSPPETNEQVSSSPTDPDPRDPTTSTIRSGNGDDDSPSAADPSVDTTLEDDGAASDTNEESTTSTTVTRVTGQMTLPYTSLKALGIEDGPPELTGGRVAVGEFSLAPAEGIPGGSLELSFRFDRAIPGLASVRVMMDDTALGDQIPVDDSSFSVRRIVPHLPPDTYEVTVLSGDLLLAAAEFTVLERSASESSTPPVVVLGVLALVAGLGWRATRIFHGSKASSGTSGLVDKWYAWREGRRR